MEFVVSVTVRLSLQVEADSEREARYRAEKASDLMFNAVNGVWDKDKKPVKFSGWFHGYRSGAAFQKAKCERGTLDLYAPDRIKADNAHFVRRSSPSIVTVQPVGNVTSDLQAGADC